MPYDLYPAVDENYDFPPEVRVALSKSMELRHDIEPMTAAIRNALLAAEKWDGRVIVNTDTDRIERYDATAAVWKVIPEMADIQATPPSVQTGFRNVLRNSDMRVAQRGDGPFTTGSYTIDGWGLDFSGGSASVVRTNFIHYQPSFTLDFSVSGQSVATNYARLLHFVEDVRTLSGSTVTVSFLAKASSGTPRVAVEIEQEFGSGGSPVVGISGGIVTLSTTLTRYSLTLTIPSTAGKTIGANNRLGLGLWISAGSNFSSRVPGLGYQSGTFSFSEVQLEEGSVATPFERLPIQQQLSWCQRYFLRYPTQMYIVAPIINGWAWSNVNTTFLLRFPVTMRVTPTAAVSNPAHFYVTTNNGSNIPFSNLFLEYLYPDGGTITCQTAAPQFVNGSGSNFVTIDSAGYVAFSAEL